MPVFLFSSAAVVCCGEQGSTGHNLTHTSVCKDILFRCWIFFFSPRSVITEHSVCPTYSEKCYLCCAGMFSSPRVVWLCLLILIRTGTVFTPCSKSSFSPGYDHLCLETQAVALVSTSDYLCARISGICILFFQIQAFKY